MVIVSYAELMKGAGAIGDPLARLHSPVNSPCAAPLADGVTAEQITGVRMRAYTRPRRDIEPILPAGTGRVRLRRLNGVFMLDEQYRPGAVRLRWAGLIEACGETAPVPVPAPPSSNRTR